MRFQRITVFGPKFKFWCDLFAICSDLACDLGASFFQVLILNYIKLHPQACTGALSRSAGSQENIVLVKSEDGLCFLSSHAPSMESEGTAPLRPACRHLPRIEDRRLFTAKCFTITRSQVQRSQIISIDTTRFCDARRPLKAIWRFSWVCFRKASDLAFWASFW